ncbi:hypothetical protein JCGZ_08182 [Jatropha curcas]|uniref:Uncharacterized protein n=1 Tax=Jatropha curcas TaxID=180498 RepID=A0A067KKW6_JATCU|nr:hypothetical protein JCGZ_08182 [Jatropha curcas]
MQASTCFSSSTLILLLLFLVKIWTTTALVKLPPNVTVPALLVFGDSIVDSGNNNNIRTIVKCDFLPYGINFKGGTPTGRFCDGKIPSDILAEELGIKDTVPAYMDPEVKDQDLLTGVTFASGASGYDPLTSKLTSVMSLDDQLEQFKEYIEKLKEIVGEEKTNFILANSVFLVVAGSDDIANTYYTLRVRKLQYDVPAYTDLMLDYASTFVQNLYDLGARRIAVFSAPPIGCVPAQRTLAGGSQRECAEDFNKAATLFNSKLSKKLDSFNMPDAKVVYVDVYNPLLNIIQDPNQFGFEVVNKGCCGSGNLEVSVLCNRLTPFICSNTSDHVFWDSYHPTERAYRVLVSQLLVKYLDKFF